jgi:hypothetical protein
MAMQWNSFLPLLFTGPPGLSQVSSPPPADPTKPSRALLKLIKQRVAPLAGATAEDVLASDLRLRRRLAGERGRQSGFVTGGLSESTAMLTLPSLVGI